MRNPVAIRRPLIPPQQGDPAMKSTALTLKLLAALVAGGALLTALPAQAGRDHDDRRDRHDGYYDRHDDRGWRGEHRGRGHNRHDRYRERWDSRHEHVVIREKVIVRRPVVREYRYYERPAPVYSYSRDPSIVIGVNIPPIVIPLR
jgi:hypothetical protein